MAEDLPSSSSSSYYYYGVLEFLLRQPIPNYIVHKIFLLLPISPPLPLRLAKTLLLRRLYSLPVSEQSLLSLELIHSLNLSTGAYDRRPSLLPHLIQSAYLHAAVGSTLAPLRNGDLPDFFDAVRRIWMMRVEDLAKSEAKWLVSDGLLRWKRNMEAASEPSSKGTEMRDMVLMEWRVDAEIEAVKDYLVMELEVMGNTVLEMAAEEFFDGGGVVHDNGCVGVENECGDTADDCVVIEGGENSGGEGKRLDAECNVLEERGEAGDSRGSGCDDDGCVGVEKERGNKADACVVIEGGENSGGVGKRLDVECNVLEEGVEEGTQEEADVSSKGIGNGGCVAMEVGGAPDDVGVSSRGIDTVIISVPTPEVNKMKEKLRRSRENLQNVVEDPLPNAKKAASRVIASRRKKVMHLEKPTENCTLNEPEQNQNAVDVSEAVHSAEMGTTIIHNESISGDVELNKDPDKGLCPSLMDWNPTARTYGWEDESIGSESASPSKKLHLSTPKTIKVSPLKPVQFKKVGRRRKRWKMEEVDALRAGVDKHGVGKWKLILNDNPSAFDERTEVDLKDKWRNLTKS